MLLSGFLTSHTAHEQLGVQQRSERSPAQPLPFGVPSSSPRFFCPTSSSCLCHPRFQPQCLLQRALPLCLALQSASRQRARGTVTLSCDPSLRGRNPLWPVVQCLKTDFSWILFTFFCLRWESKSGTCNPTWPESEILKHLKSEHSSPNRDGPCWGLESW